MPLENGNGAGFSVQMPVAPAYGGGYAMPYGGMGNFGGLFGGDGSWLLLLILLCGGGWGGLGGFGMGGMMWPMMMGMGGGFGGIDYLYPWLNNSQNINDGFRDQQLNSTVQGIQSAVTSGFGDVQTALCSGFGNVQNSLCQGFAGVNQNISNTAAQGEIAANGRHNALTGQLYNGEINALNRSFAEQTANAQGFNGVGTGIADLKYTIATENCADRYEAVNNTRDIITNATGNTTALLNTIRDGIQSIKDDLCADRLDAERRENANLRSELMYARGQASQDVQTARILAGQTSEVDALYNRLNQCPVGTVPVYGRTPIFSCNGCNGNANNAFFAA